MEDTSKREERERRGERGEEREERRERRGRGRWEVHAHYIRVSYYIMCLLLYSKAPLDIFKFLLDNGLNVNTTFNNGKR